MKTRKAPTSRSTNSKRIILFAVLSLALCSGKYYIAGKGRAMADIPQVRYSIEGLRDRVSLARHSMIHSDGTVWEKACFQQVGQSTGKMIQVWEVDWENAHGELLGHAVWDADSGRILVANHPTKRFHTVQADACDSRTAVQGAWRWMTDLGVTWHTPSWHLAASPQLTKLCWIVTWQTKGFSATVFVDQYTLDLVYLMVKQV